MTDWKSHQKENPERQLFFIILGTKKLSIFIKKQNAWIELKEIKL